MRRIAHVPFPVAFSAALLAAPSPTPAAGSLEAQDQPVPLEGLVVTAHRRPAPEWTVASHVTVVDGEALERAGIEYVADALRQVAGLAVVRNGSFGATTSVFLRGGESDHVQVLLDGVPVNEPGGRFDFGAVGADNVERIEIVRGPASALYGSDAVSGVIHIMTRRGAGRPTADLSFQAGSFGTRRWQGGVSGGTGLLSYAFSLGRNDADGILPFNNVHRLTTATGRVHVQPDLRTDASLSVRYEDHRFHYPTDGSGRLVDRNAFAFGDALAVALDAGRRWTDAVETRLALSVHESDGGTDDASDGPADTLGFFGFKSLNDARRARADARGTWRFAGESTLTAGVELERQSVRDFSRSLSQYGTSHGASENERSNRAVYVQLAAVLGRGQQEGTPRRVGPQRRRELAWNAGARLEDNERFGTAATWSAGAAWRLRPSGTLLRVSLGTGIKEPTFFESFASGFAIGNPELEPERSTGVEGGVEQSFGKGRVEMSVTGFWQSYRNLIQYTFSPPVAGGPNYYNVAEARSRGAEAEAQVDAGPVRLNASYTWLDTEVRDAGFDEGPGAAFVEGQPLPRRPTHTVAAGVFLPAGDRATVDLAARRIGERADRDFATWPAVAVVLPAYTVLDVAANVRVFGGGGPGPALVLTIRAENLLGAEYEEAQGFPAPGRGVYVGGKVSFGGSR